MKLELAAMGTGMRALPAHKADAIASGQDGGASAFARLTEKQSAEPQAEAASQSEPDSQGRELPADKDQGNAIAALVAVLENGVATTRASAGGGEAGALTGPPRFLQHADIVAGNPAGIDRAIEKPGVPPDDLPDSHRGMESNAAMEVRDTGRVVTERASAEQSPVTASRTNAHLMNAFSPTGENEKRAGTRVTEAVRPEPRATAAAPYPVAPSYAVAPSLTRTGDRAALPDGPAATAARDGNTSPPRSLQPELVPAVARQAQSGSNSAFGSDAARLQPRVVQGQNTVASVPVGNFWQVVTTASGPSIVNSLSALPGAPVLTEAQQAPQFSMQIQLNPKSLGEVSVHITRVGGTVHVDIRTQTVQAEHLLKSDSANLLDAFKAGDGRIEEVNLRVATNQESSGSVLRNGRESEREAWFGRSSFEGADAGKSGHGGNERWSGQSPESHDFDDKRRGGDNAIAAPSERRAGTYL